jgi:elongator complex protein 1
LATHLAGGGAAAALLLPRALEEVGELSELLVLLGHADDAAALQNAVATAVDAATAAAAEARGCLTALDAADAADAAASSGGGVGAPWPAGSAGSAVGAVGLGSNANVAPAPAQWKWAVMRGSNAAEETAAN